MLPFDYIGPPPESGPLPAFLYLSISAEESLHLEPYCQPATYASDDWLRIFSLTLPGHDEGQDKQRAITYWAEEMAKGNDVLTPFIEQAATTLQQLIEKEVIDAQHIAIGGLSRGAFLAAHIAARLPQIKTFVGFAPMTKLSLARGFENLDVAPFDCETVVEKLTHLHHVRFYIGNRDTLVTTDACYSFIRALTETAHEKRQRTCKPELILYPAVGREGHGTPPAIFKAGAAFVKEALHGGEA